MRGLVACFVANNDTDDLLTIASQDGVNWTPNRRGYPHLASRPALVRYGGNFYVAFRNGRDELVVEWGYEEGAEIGIRWPPEFGGELDIGIARSYSFPALVVVTPPYENNWLGMYFTAANDTSTMLYMKVETLSAWGHHTASALDGVSSQAGPAVVSHDRGITMAFLANNDTNDLLVLQGGPLSGLPHSSVGGSSKFAPALAFFRGQYWMAFVANNDTNDLLVANSDDGRQWSEATRIGGSSKDSPALAVLGDRLYMALVANNDSNDLLIKSSADGEHWSPDTRMNQSSKYAPALASTEEPAQWDPGPRWDVLRVYRRWVRTRYARFRARRWDRDRT
jgi:hypothetical protein